MTSRRNFLHTAGTAAAVAATGRVAWALPPDAPDRARLADAALAAARKAGASYADVRINRYVNQSLSAREKRLQNAFADESYGAGVRVLVNGTWGFAASSRVTPETL